MNGKGQDHDDYCSGVKVGPSHGSRGRGLESAILVVQLSLDFLYIID